MKNEWNGIMNLRKVAGVMCVLGVVHLIFGCTFFKIRLISFLTRVLYSLNKSSGMAFYF